MAKYKKKMFTVIAFCISFLFGSLGLSHAQAKNSDKAVEENETVEQQISNKGQAGSSSTKKKKKGKKKGQSKKKRTTKKKQSKKERSSTEKPAQVEEVAVEESTEK